MAKPDTNEIREGVAQGLVNTDDDMLKTKRAADLPDGELQRMIDEEDAKVECRECQPGDTGDIDFLTETEKLRERSPTLADEIEEMKAQGGTAYVVIEDGEVRRFQHHKPGAIGRQPITPSELPDVAEADRREIVARRAANRAAAALREQ